MAGCSTIRPCSLSIPQHSRAAQRRYRPVVLHRVAEPVLDAGQDDHALRALRGVTQASQDVAADFNLHRWLAEVDVASIAQFKLHHFSSCSGGSLGATRAPARK